mmetsp:Transcript_17247/g.40010  ORF Transcript_17247/g.40010 Transcript_17247/m.40010 type:complete len:123 (+) Transcript_17247:1441-1809(+)
MEDPSNILYYLVIGVIYLLVKRYNIFHADDQPETEKPAGQYPVPEIRNTERSKTWENALQEESMKRPLHQYTTKEMTPHIVQKTKIRPAKKQTPNKKIDQMLGRYKRWQKAVIMSELMQPYS